MGWWTNRRLLNETNLSSSAGWSTYISRKSIHLFVNCFFSLCKYSSTCWLNMLHNLKPTATRVQSTRKSLEWTQRVSQRWTVVIVLLQCKVFKLASWCWNKLAWDVGIIIAGLEWTGHLCSLSQENATDPRCVFGHIQCVTVVVYSIVLRSRCYSLHTAWQIAIFSSAVLCAVPCGQPTSDLRLIFSIIMSQSWPVIFFNRISNG